MDFEDYALGGVGAGAGLALGGGVIGKYIGNKWGEDAYYRSKARSLGRESDASVDYDQQSRALLESNLPEKQKIRELQKLKVQRDRVIGDSTRNRESDAEVSRWLNKAKGIGVGTLGAGAVGGALGLGYGVSNDFSGDKQHFANFNSTKNNKNMTKFTRKYDSTYIQFKRAYNKAVAEFGVLDAIRGSSVKQRLGAGAGLAGLAGGGLLAYKALRGETPDIDFEGLRQQAEGYGGQAGKYLGDLRQQGQQYIDGNENIRNLREQGKAYGAKAGKYLSQQGGYLRDKIESRVPLPPQWNGDYQSPVGIPQSITGEEVGYSPQSIGSYNDYQAPSAIPQSLTGQQDNSRLYHATKILRESGRNRYQG
jgi:hypothetical protein